MSSEQHVPIVDLRNLAQTDIQRLATSNSSYFNIESLTTIIPVLDPSTFNESASSRKQTFSRLPLNNNSNNAEDVPNPNTRRVGRPVNPSPSLGLRPRDDDVENKENLLIVSALKKLFAIREKGESFGKMDREMRNLNGEEIDLEGLAKKVDLYDEVIRKKTEGLEKEEQLLGYMTALDGEWGSSRKKRKIVDAGVFGCELPKGWKVLLGLKRKNRHVFLHCREYVSPSGKHFISCKDVSSYILSLNGQHDSSQQISAQHAVSASETAKALVNVTNQTDRDVNKLELGNCSYVTPVSYISTECEKQGQLFNNTDSSEKSLQCQRYNLTFVDEDAKSYHLSTSHRSDKRRRLGQSFTESVIMKDGKYECQLCHETFTEKQSYNQHIGAHIRYGSLKKGDGGVTEMASSISNSSASLTPYDQSKNNIFVNANAEASMHSNSVENITEAISKQGEHHLNESVTEGAMDIRNTTSSSLMPYDQSKDDITVKENAVASTHYDSAKHTTEAVFKEEEYHLNESVTEVARDISNSTPPSLAPYDQSKDAITVKENAEASTHYSAKHTTEAVYKESEHNLDESVIVGAVDINKSSFASLRPCDQSKNNVSTNENTEASLQKDSAKHITEAVSKEAEHSLKVSVHTDDLSASNLFDSPFKDGVHDHGDMKGITCNDGNMDISSHACTNISSPSGIYVTNKFYVSSPTIIEVPFTEKSIHYPINECEVTHIKSGILDDLNVESEKSKVYQDSPSPSAYENKTKSVAGGSMVDSKTETQLAASRVISMNGSEENFDIPKDNCVGGQTNNCDIITGNSSDSVTSTSMSVDFKTETHLPASKVISMDTSEEIFEIPKDNSTGVQTKNCEIIINDSTGATDTSTAMSVDSKTATYLTASSVIPMDIPEEIFEIPNEHSMGGENNDCGIVAGNDSDVVGTSNTMSAEASACMISFSSSLNNIDGTRDEQPNAIECDDQNKLEEHHFLSFSGNEPKFAGETYGGFFTSKENEMVESNDYMHGKDIFASTMHNELSTNCDFPNIANEPTSGIETNADCMFPGDLNKSLFDEADNIGYEFQTYFQSRSARNENASSDIMENSDGTQALQIASTMPEQSSSWVQTSDSLNFLDLMPNQCTNNQRNEQERISGFDDLSLGSIEPSDFALFTGQSSASATRSPMELFPDHQLEWGMSFNKTPANSAGTAVCAWCSGEFSLQGDETDPQSGSLGYICPHCKAQISGQFGMFNSGFS